MGIPKPHPPTLAEIEQQREELLAQVDLPSQRSTSPAGPDPASPPIMALPTLIPIPESRPYRYVAGRGRPITLWSAIDCEYTQLTQEEAAEPEEYPEEETWSA